MARSTVFGRKPLYTRPFEPTHVVRRGHGHVWEGTPIMLKDPVGVGPALTEEEFTAWQEAHRAWRTSKPAGLHYGAEQAWDAENPEPAWSAFATYRRVKNRPAYWVDGDDERVHAPRLHCDACGKANGFDRAGAGLALTTIHLNPRKVVAVCTGSRGPMAACERRAIVDNLWGCAVCGGYLNDRDSGLVCSGCQRTMTANAQLAASDAVVAIPRYVIGDDGRKRLPWELNQQLDRVRELLPAVAAGGRQIVRRDDGEAKRWLARRPEGASPVVWAPAQGIGVMFSTGEEHAEAIREFTTALDQLLRGLRNAGQQEGRSMLMQLASGELSADELNRASILQDALGQKRHCPQCGSQDSLRKVSLGGVPSRACTSCDYVAMEGQLVDDLTVSTSP